MNKYFTKTHYEHAIRHLETVAPTLLVQRMLDIGHDPTYQQFCMAALEGLEHLDSRQMKNHFLNVYFHMYQMKNNAEQIYYITPELSARLAQTNCNSDTYFLRSPFREIYIQIEPGLFYINDLEGGKSPVDGFYVYLRDYEGLKHIRVMACSLLKPTPDIPFNDATFYFHIEMEPGKIQDRLKVYLENEIKRKKEKLDQYDTYKNVDHLGEFAQFVFNTLMYITSKSPDVVDQEPFDFDKRIKSLKNKTKKRKLEQRKEKATSKNIIIVGSKIKDKNNDMLGIKRAGGIGKWKLDHKVKVEAHWRTQWYGSKKEGTRYKDNIWIDNYEKGPEYAEILTSKHVVK
jgi:hypothetical protein